MINLAPARHGTHVTERGTHDDGLVLVLLVVVEDLLHRLNTRVLISGISRAGLSLLVPVENLWPMSETALVPASPRSRITYTANERRDESNASLGARHGLCEAEKEGQVAVDAVIALELARSLDALPGRSNLDEDALLLDTNGVVEGNKLLGLGLGRLLVERETGVDLG